MPDDCNCCQGTYNRNSVVNIYNPHTVHIETAIGNHMSVPDYICCIFPTVKVML